MSDAQLSGITVVSLAEQFPGPYATLLLADLGADVILVERPGVGDPTRLSSPDFHESLNRNKRSVGLDLKAVDGRKAFLRLASEADVVVEGFRPGVVTRLGVDYEAVRNVNPGIVYVSISGFGQHGPMRDRPGHDISLQAISGLLHDRLDQADLGPAPWLAVGDLSAGTFAALAALTGLVSRTKTGEGSHFDVSMTDGLLSWMTPFLFAAANPGAAMPGLPPEEPGYGLYRTADGGAISLSIAFEDWFWAPLCHVLGLDEHIAMPASDRQQRCAELRAILADVFRRRTRAQWEVALDVDGIPFSPVLSMADVVAHDHLRDRSILLHVPGDDNHPTRHHVRQPLAVRGVNPHIDRHVPRIGEHTAEVLRSIGYSDGEIDRLVASGAAAI